MNLQEKILKYASDQKFYMEMSEIAKKRAEELMNANNFVKVIQDIERELSANE